MIAVEVGEKDAVDVNWDRLEAAQGNHRRGAAVDEESSAGMADEDAALEPPAAAEGIAAAEELDLNRLSSGMHHAYAPIRCRVIDM